MSKKPAIRMGKQIAMSFEPGRGHAKEVIELPSISQAKRYVRVNNLDVHRGEFKIAPHCKIHRATCPSAARLTDAIAEVLQ